MPGKDDQSPKVLLIEPATAIKIRIVGRTTMSFIPASIRRACRIDLGIRVSRITSRRTTGSVEARIAPPMNARRIGSPISQAIEPAPRAMIITVPGPSTSTGTSQRARSSSICSLTASRNRTSASVRVATISSTGACTSSSIRLMPPSPSARPSRRNKNAKERGDRSTRPDASGVASRTTAISANPDTISFMRRLY